MRPAIERPHRYQPTGWLKEQRARLVKANADAREIKSIDLELKHRKVKL